MFTAIQNGSVYEVRFTYDPLLVDIIKNVPNRKWEPTGRYWSIPTKNLGFLISAIQGTQYENELKIQSLENINENASLEVTAHIPDIDVSNVPFYIKEGSEPYDHQWDFMKYAIDRWQKGNHNGFLLADEMGLGKTVEATNLGIYLRRHEGFKHCLIICCINTSKYNWLNDIADHTRGKMEPYLLGSRLKKDKKTIRYADSKEKYEDLMTLRKYGKEDGDPLPYFLVINIEALRYKIGKRYPITERIAQLINAGIINMVAIDEIHKNTSLQSIQGKQLEKLKKLTDNKCTWLPMTGTPVLGKPTDLYLSLKLVGAHLFSSYYTWNQHFCLFGGYDDHDIVGYRNIPQIKQMLQSNMLRRRKQDVLDLPPCIEYTEYVELTPYQTKLYKQVSGEILAERGTILQSMNPLAKFLRLRQAAGSPEIVDLELAVDKEYIKKNAKLVRVLELLAEANERGEKTLVYSNWVEPLRTLYRFIAKRYNVLAYTGTMKEADRERNKQLFQNDPKYTVMIGTIGAMGTSHTLTAANNVIFIDEPWLPSEKKQAMDRAHRISTTKTVNVYTILAKNTIDDRVHDIVYTKKAVADYIVDDEFDLRGNPELFDWLLQDSLK